MPFKPEDDDQVAGAERTRTVVTHTLAVVGALLFLLGVAHNVVGLPLVLKATADGTIDLPSVVGTGVGFRLTREPVVYGHIFMGVDTCLFGALLVLFGPELRRGRKTAWRICTLIGTVEFVGYTAVWVIFEHAHLRPLVMPAVGLLILVPLVLGRHSFTEE